MVNKSAQMGWEQRGAANEAELQQAADHELEACCKWLDFYSSATDARDLRIARRPTPPSLKEQALETLNSFEGFTGSLEEVCIIRRALEQLND